MDAMDATRTFDCRFPGCDGEASSRVGRYSYCTAHRDRSRREALLGDTVTARAQPSGAGAGSSNGLTVASATGGGTGATASTNGARIAVGMAARIKALSNEARAVDKLFERSRKATATAIALKREADAAHAALERKLREL